jgi:hypothetical protein
MLIISKCATNCKLGGPVYSNRYFSVPTRNIVNPVVIASTIPQPATKHADTTGIGSTVKSMSLVTIIGILCYTLCNSTAASVQNVVGQSISLFVRSISASAFSIVTETFSAALKLFVSVVILCATLTGVTIYICIEPKETSKLIAGSLAAGMAATFGSYVMAGIMHWITKKDEY